MRHRARRAGGAAALRRFLSGAVLGGAILAAGALPAPGAAPALAAGDAAATTGGQSSDSGGRGTDGQSSDNGGGADAGANGAPVTGDEAQAEKTDAASASDAEIAAGDEAMLEFALKPWTGDLEGMKKRRIVRVLVVPNRLYFFTDRFRYRGLLYELFKEFEADLNKRLKLKKHEHVSVVFVPVENDKLIPGLLDGTGDIAAGNLTITSGREDKVAFSSPFETDVKEILVTGPAAKADIHKMDDLAGTEIVVRKSSSYYESLTALNETFKKRGLDEITITLADERLEDNDIAEMVNAGIYPSMVMDLHKAAVWVQVFDAIRVHKEIVFREGGETGWAMRKESPELKKAVDAFMKTHRQGTGPGNILINRYLKSTRYVKNPLAESERQRFEDTVSVFRKYAGKYDFDWLLLIAQGYQESGLDQTARSRAGAVGIMQVLPQTAAAPPIGIKDVETVDGNVHAGVKYLRLIVDTYFDTPEITHADKHLFAFASYNAGPTRIGRLRLKAKARGLDPDKWFDNVEHVVALYVGRQPVEYVRNIFKYYLAYRRIETEKKEREAAKKKAGK